MLAGPTAVLGIQPQQAPQTVYNLEVQGQHVFRVTSNGLLVHNMCADDIAKLAGDTAKKIFGKAPRVADLPWGRVGARQAAKAIESGQTSIKVASRDDAAEVVWRMFSSRGFTNTTGRTGNDVRKILGSKASTYHWDEVLDEAGNLSGHGAGNIHGAMRHVQIHLVDKTIIRIFFP
jgi:hypothetical protein